MYLDFLVTMLAQPCSVTKHFCISPSISLHQFSMAGRAKAVRIVGYKCNMRGCDKQCKEDYSLVQHLWTSRGIEENDVKPFHWKEITEGCEEDGSDASDEVRPVPTSHKRSRSPDDDPGNPSSSGLGKFSTNQLLKEIRSRCAR